MIKVAILPLPSKQGDISYRAVAGDKESRGNTAGKALDALTPQLPPDETGLMVIIQSLHPDRFFDAAQQQRLAELEALTEAELRASAARAGTLADELAR